MDQYTAFLLIQSLQLLWLVGLTAFAYLRRPGLDASAALRKFEEHFAKTLTEHAESLQRHMGAQDNRLTELETHLEHMPSSEELAQLQGHVRAIDERTQGMLIAMQGMKTGVERIHDFLLNERKP